MRVRFWGVRGSLPSPMSTETYQKKLAMALVAAQNVTFNSPAEIAEFSKRLAPQLRRVVGGNTPCVEVFTKDGERLILDAGSGIRELGHALLTNAANDETARKQIHLLFSHTHWDHIMGFPFFPPLYQKDWEIHCYGGHEDLEERLRNQHDPRNFPVSFDAFVPKIHVETIPMLESQMINGFMVTAGILDHPGDSFAYKIEHNGETVVYATDGAFNDETKMGILSKAGFFKDADAIIFDSMLTYHEAITIKRDWGHSAASIGVDICLRENIKRLVLFHHNPDNDDERLFDMLEETIMYKTNKAPESKLQIDLACESWEFPVKPEIVPDHH